MKLISKTKMKEDGANALGIRSLLPHFWHPYHRHGPTTVSVDDVVGTLLAAAGAGVKLVPVCEALTWQGADVAERRERMW
jgi:hypothetical protein